jgi:exopolyphosphatase/guanosine-5'-triphosphate,3'-diphosphate pyrophosphatase
MIIARVQEDRKVFPIAMARRITRLSRGFFEAEILKEESIRESIAVLQEFASLLHRHNVKSVRSRATGVVRRARNAVDFLQKIRDATGIDTQVLSEQEEALLSAKGMLSGLQKEERFVLAFDVGGSSTELILVDTRSSQPLLSTSIFIGAATITERCLPGDPPQKEDVSHAAGSIQDALRQVLSELKQLSKDLEVPLDVLQLVGTAGTMTTLAAMLLEMDAYDPSRVNGLIMMQGWLSRLIDDLAAMPVARRRKIPGLENGRESIILGGALIVRELLRGLERKQVTVVDSGLLEGLLLDLIESEYGWPSSLSSPLTLSLQEG